MYTTDTENPMNIIDMISRFFNPDINMPFFESNVSALGVDVGDAGFRNSAAYNAWQDARNELLDAANKLLDLNQNGGGTGPNAPFFTGLQDQVSPDSAFANLLLTTALGSRMSPFNECFKCDVKPDSREGSRLNTPRSDEPEAPVKEVQASSGSKTRDKDKDVVPLDKKDDTVVVADETPDKVPSTGGTATKANISIDPADWKLTLPVDGDGNTTGRAAEVKGDDLVGFSSKQYYIDEETKSLIFSADAEAAKTSANTKYGRSELREMNGDELAAWSVADSSALTARLSVDEMGTENDGDASRVVVGQIHGEDDELARLYYDSDGEVYFANEITGEDGKERLFGFENENGESPSIALLEEWSYKIEVKDGKLLVEIEVDGELYKPVQTDGVDPTKINSEWADDKFYFKAGVYNQVNDLDGHHAQGAGVTTASFRSLDVGHNGAGLGASMGGGLTWE